MTTPSSVWPVEYHIMVEYVERLNRQLGQLDAASAATERRLLQLEQALRAVGSVPSAGTLDEHLLADPLRFNAPPQPDQASAPANMLLITQFLSHIELLSRALGRNDGSADGIERRLNELTAYVGSIETDAADDQPTLEAPVALSVIEPVASEMVALDDAPAFSSAATPRHDVAPRFEVIIGSANPEPAPDTAESAVVRRMPWVDQLDIATIALPILLLLALVYAVVQVGDSGSDTQLTPSPNPAAAHATASAPPAEAVGTVHSHGSPLVTTPTVRPATATSGASPSASATPAGASPTSATTASPASTSTGVAGATATATSAATAPAADATATVVGEATATSVAPTEPSVAPTLVALVTGGVGSTRADVEQTFGVQESTNAAGEAVYQEGSVFVLYSADERALRVTFDFSGDDLTDFDRAAATSLAAYYRPADAQLVGADPAAGGVERAHYTSASLTAAFASQDTAGRDAAGYVEELHFDATTDRPLSIVMALGQTP